MWIESYFLGVMEVEFLDDLLLLLIIYLQGRMKSVVVVICQGFFQWLWVLFIDLFGVQFFCVKLVIGLCGGGGVCFIDILFFVWLGILLRLVWDWFFFFIISGWVVGLVVMWVFFLFYCQMILRFFVVLFCCFISGILVSKVFQE